MFDRATDGSGEAGAGIVEAVHDQKGLPHAAARQFGSCCLEQSCEDTLSARRGMDHAAEFGLVRAISVDAEEADQAVFADPEEVVLLLGRSRLEDTPLELESSTIYSDAGGREPFDGMEVLRREPWF